VQHVGPWHREVVKHLYMTRPYSGSNGRKDAQHPEDGAILQQHLPNI